MKHINLLVLSVFLVFFSCRQDEIIDEGPTQTPVDLTDHYVIDVTGVIVDLNNVPISEVEVQVNEQSISTDENGIFTVSQVQASEKGLYFKATKAGYFHGGQHLFPNSLSSLKVKISMIPFHDTKEFNSQNGIDYISGLGHKVTIPPNGVSIDGSPYDGQVIFNSIWLDPSDANTFENMPGALIALNENQQLSTLKSYGMIAVELLTPSGDKVNLSTGTNASLEFPVPNQMLSEAPSEIDLWHFDEEEGLWKKEGSATIQEQSYHAEVSHFSWWNCDIPNTFVQLCLQFIENSSNEPIPNVYFSLYSGQYGIAFGISDEEGKYCNLVPDNETIELEIYSSCNEVILTDDIGPFTIPNSTMNVILDPSIDFYNINITGILLDCNNDPVTNGYVYTKSTYNHQIGHTDANGLYNMDFYVSCEDELVLEGYDLDLLTLSSQNLALDGSNSYTVNFNTCGETIDSYLRYEVDGQQFIIEGCQAKQTPKETLILAEDDVSKIKSIMGINGFSTGQFDGNNISDFTSENDATFTISQYGEVGELISGSFIAGDATGNFVAERTR